jgi:hypothetical protein
VAAGTGSDQGPAGDCGSSAVDHQICQLGDFQRLASEDLLAADDDAERRVDQHVNPV